MLYVVIARSEDVSEAGQGRRRTERHHGPLQGYGEVREHQAAAEVAANEVTAARHLSPSRPMR